MYSTALKSFPITKDLVNNLKTCLRCDVCFSAQKQSNWKTIFFNSCSCLRYHIPVNSYRCLRYHVPVNIAADVWDITYPSIATGAWDTLSICFKSYRYLRYVPYTSTAYIFDICTIYVLIVLYLNSYKCKRYRVPHQLHIFTGLFQAKNIYV